MGNKRLLLTTLLALAFVTLACSLSLPQPAPTVTVEPTVFSIPGWQKFTGGEAELWLPQSFQGGDLSQDLETIVGQLKSLGPEFEQLVKQLESNPEAYVLWLFDSGLGPSGFMTNVAVAHQEVLSVVTVDNIIDAFETQLPQAFQVADRQKMQLGQREAARIVIDTVINGVSGSELMYVIKDKNVIWFITYATGADEFEARLPVFEQSAATFEVRP